MHLRFRDAAAGLGGAPGRAIGADRHVDQLRRGARLEDPEIGIGGAAAGQDVVDELDDEDALVAALQEGRVAGAAVDVFSQEPVTEHALFGLPNVVVTPHLGASTDEAQTAVSVEACKAIVDYFFNSVQHPFGNSLYYMRNHFFYVESVARLAPRATLFTAYRINKDTGQGNRLADPTGNPGTLIASYPMSFQSPERMAENGLPPWLP